MIGWRGDRRDERLADIIAASRALLEGGPRLAPRVAGAPRPARRSLIAGGALVVTAAAVAGTFGLRKQICDAAGLLCPGGAASPPKSLAVLPFDNLSGDPSQAYFCEGLSEELLDRLAHVPQLQVAGRTSAFKFKGGKDDAATIGAKLGVAYILDGSVRRSDTVVRVSAQLIEAKTGFERWSQSYDRDLRDVFAVQDDIAASVTQALKLKLLGGTAAAAPGARESRVPAAHDAYLQGRKLFDSSAGRSGPARRHREIRRGDRRGPHLRRAVVGQGPRAPGPGQSVRPGRRGQERLRRRPDRRAEGRRPGPFRGRAPARDRGDTAQHPPQLRRGPALLRPGECNGTAGRPTCWSSPACSPAGAATS